MLDILALVSGGAPRANNRATVILGRERRGARTVLGLAVDEVLRVAPVAEISETEPGDGLVRGTVSLDGRPVKILDTSVLFADDWRPTEDVDA